MLLTVLPACADSAVKHQLTDRTAFLVCEYRHRCQLIVQGAKGGRWSFPLEFTAAEPEPDEVINIQAVGLNKLSTVSFHLNSYNE